MFRAILLAIRSLKKRPGYSAAVLATLTAGIGATTVMFSLVDAALLRPLPFAHPERLVALTGVAGPQRAQRGGSFPEIFDWKALNATLADVAIVDVVSLNLRVETTAVRVPAEMVSAGYFQILGVSAAVGRTFLPEEDAVVDRNPVAVISHDLWTSKFGGDPGVIQRTIHLNDRPMTIVGVMPKDFSGVSFNADVWFPSMMVGLSNPPSSVTNRGNRWLGAIARLKPEVALPRVQEDMNRVAAILEQQHPDYNRQRGVQVDGLRDLLIGTRAGLVRALFGAVILLLLVACANVASLQLARAAGRRRDVAVRIALGAGRWHIARELLAESLVLAVAAGILGTLLAAWAMSAIVALTPAGALPRYVQASIDFRAVGFALATSFLTGIVVSIAPAVAARRADLSGSMKEGARSAEPGLGSIRRPSLQQALVVGELALAMTLVSGAAIMLRSLERQLHVPLGFQPHGVTVARITLPSVRYPAPARAAFADRAVAGLRALPGVTSAAVATSLPFTGSATAANFYPDGRSDDAARRRYFRTHVTPEFFTTLGIALTRGRAFTDRDRADTPLVAIVNESAAARLWGAANAVGQRIRLGTPDGPSVEIVGVAADARLRDLTTDLAGARTEPDMYFPFAQRPVIDIEIAVRTATAAGVPLTDLQRVVTSLDPGVPVYAARTLGETVEAVTAPSRFGSMLLAVFGAGTVLLAALGLYGLIAYIVGRSRREIAIRLALGANPRRVAALIVGNGMTLVVAGVGVGLAGAAGAARALESQLFQSSGLEIGTQAGVMILLTAIAAIAIAISTRRAVRVDPQLALRAE